jgi:hypothetical protein
MSNKYTPAQLAAYAVRITGSDCWDDVDTSNEAAVIDRIEALRSNEEFAGLSEAALKLIVSAYHGLAQAYCAESNVAIREATMEEALESGLTSYEGIIEVDDYSESVYVLA